MNVTTPKERSLLSVISISAKFVADSLAHWHSQMGRQNKQRMLTTVAYQMPNIKSMTLVTIDFAGAATLPVARRPASRLTFVLAFGSYGRGKAPSWLDAPVFFRVSGFEGKDTMKPP